ncbi:MAG: hypothetical protein ACE5E3_04040 [Mariprofundus sp.]
MNRIFANQKKVLLAVTMLFSCLFSVHSANAGVGMLEEGENLYISDLNFSFGNKYWDSNRQVINSICKRRNVSLVQGYEYGYSYFHTVFANVTFAYRKCGQITRAPRVNPVTGRVTPGWTVLGGRAAGIGDIELGVRTRFNHRDTAAWEVLLTIPTGYDNNHPSALGRGALGLGLGVRFSSDDRSNDSPWGWKLGSRFTYFFAGKGNSLRSYAAIQYAFSDTDFEQTGNFVDFRVIHNVGFARGGVQQQIFVNQVPETMTNSDQTKLQLKYSHSFNNGWATSFRAGRAIVGRNAPIDWSVGWGLSYRWRD